MVVLHNSTNATLLQPSSCILPPYGHQGGPVCVVRHPDAPIIHGFFGAFGGVSTPPLWGLNGSIMKDPQCGPGNRQRACQVLGVDPNRLAFAIQRHTTCVHILAQGQPDPDLNQPADALVTNRPGQVLGVLTADCAPVLMYAPGIIAAVHSGWRGACMGILDTAVQAMQTLGTDPAFITAIIGPTIRQISYRIQNDCVQTLNDHSPFSMAPFLAQSVDASAGEFLFDLPGYVAKRLAFCGITRVLDTGHDTFGTFFFSRRYALAQQKGHEPPPHGLSMSLIAAATAY